MTAPDAETLAPVAPQTFPALQGSPVFFMHIAKTAGSYLNAVLTDALGETQVATHVEHRLGGAADLAEMLANGRRVISGHVMNCLWEQITAGSPQTFRKVSIVREPIAHLASHLLWLDHYALIPLYELCIQCRLLSREFHYIQPRQSQDLNTLPKEHSYNLISLKEMEI